MRVRLAARSPFQLQTVVNSHGWIQLAPFAATEGGGLRYVTRLSSGRVTAVAVEAIADGVAAEVEDELDSAESASLNAQLSWMLGLEQDFSEFYALARQEPKLAQMAARAQGRVLRSPTLFEDVIKTMLTVNTTWSGTIRMNAALVRQYGSPWPGDPTRHAFPTPEQLADLDEPTLRATVKAGFRTPYILGLARAVAAGDLDLEGLKSAEFSTPDLKKRLLAIKGIGDYAAANLLMILGRYDHIPIDSWALKVVSYEWPMDRPAERQDVENAFARWGAWKGLAFWFWDWSYYHQ